MDFILYFIVDLLLDEGVGATKSNKLSIGFRRFLFTLIIIIYTVIIGLITYAGISLLKNNTIEGIFTIAFAVCILLVCIFRFKAVYTKKTQKKK